MGHGILKVWLRQSEELNMNTPLAQRSVPL